MSSHLRTGTTPLPTMLEEPAVGSRAVCGPPQTTVPVGVDANRDTPPSGADGVVNAISLYVEHGRDTFHSVHVETAAKIARTARRAGIRRFVHVSGISADTTSPSPYIRSRGEGEAAVRTAFPGAVIVRPAVMFAPDDAFLTTILRLLRSLPAYPIFGDGKTRLQPVYVDDVAAAIAQILRQSQNPYPVYELAGPRIYSYEELLRTIARIAGLRPVLMRMPFAFWNALAGVAEMLPQPPLTRNQVELMQIDTTASESLPGFRDQVLRCVFVVCQQGFHLDFILIFLIENCHAK